MPSRWFRISFVENAFRRFVTESDRTLDSPRAAETLGLVLAFYREKRAQHSSVADEGDGLLWQWGPDADAARFTVSLTRQLIREDAEPIVQFTVALAYRWTPARRALGRGHEWCFDPKPPGITEFERVVRTSAAYRAVASATPTELTIRTDTI
ncbi:MAG TPA: hypothetical protein VNT53_09835 [Pseudolysinimonas sp.]|nr:hypothetical protein [Pseudolysinimonas sp.]